MWKNKINQNWKENKQKQKQEAKKEKKWQNHLKPFFLPHLGRTFPFSKPLIQQWEGIIEIIHVWKKHEGFKKISKRSKEGWKLILVSRRDHAIALLSG